MALNYETTNWENGKTVLKAEHLRKIEKGITDIISENDAIYKDEDTRKSNEKQRQEEHLRKMNEVSGVVSDIQKDYDSLQKIIIDENASANLQNQINQTNSQLEHNEKLLSDISINVKKFGAIGDGETDDTNSIKLAINYCSNNGGGTVFLPPGSYVITDSLNLPWGVNLIGVYERSIIKPKFDTGYVLILNGRHHIENIKFYYESNDPKTTLVPKVFPATIFANDLGYSVLRNIGLGNAYIGMYLKQISGGSSIENIYGYPLKIGINIEHCIDVTPINRIHFNPNFYGVPKLELRKFVFENAEALRIGRLDFCNIDKAFAWGYKTLFTITDSPKGGSANNIKFTNWIADACQTFCIFEHHDGGISFTNGTGTFYNPYENEQIDNNIEPTVLNQFVADIKNGGTGTWGGSLVSFLNNRIYRCEKHFLRTCNPIIFLGNEITNYGNSKSEEDTEVIDCLQINLGADNSIIEGNYIDGKNKAKNRCIAIVGAEDCKVNNNSLLGWKAIDIYNGSKNTYINSILYSNKEDIPTNISDGQLIFIKSLKNYYKKANGKIVPISSTSIRKTLTSPNSDNNTIDVNGLNVIVNNGSGDYIVVNLTGGILNQRVSFINQGSIARLIFKTGNNIKLPNNKDFILDNDKGFVDLICVDENTQAWVLKP